MKKRILALFCGFAAACVLLAGSARAQDTAKPSDSADSVSSPASTNSDAGATAVPDASPSPVLTPAAPAQPGEQIGSEKLSNEDKIFGKRNSGANTSSKKYITAREKEAKKKAAKEKAAEEKAARKKAAKEKADEEKAAKKKAAESKKAQKNAARNTLTVKETTNEPIAPVNAGSSVSGAVPAVVPDADATAVQSESRQDAVQTEGTPTVRDDKFFRKKHAEHVKPPKKTTEKKEDLTAGNSKSFLWGIFSKKKKISAEPVVPSAASMAPLVKQAEPAIQGNPGNDESLSKPVKKTKGKADRYIEDSRESYVEGDIKDAEKSINLALGLDPKNREAQNYKNKIMVIKEKMIEAKRDFSEQCFFKGANYFKAGDTLDAQLFMYKALKLNPQMEKAKNMFVSIQEMNQDIVKSMGKKDGKKFKKAINFFLNEDFEASAEVFRELQAGYPEMANFMGYAIAHTSDSGNKKRSAEYVKIARKDVRNERYRKAQEDLFSALEMDRENMEAQVILEQVKIELSLSDQNSGFGELLNRQAAQELPPAQ